MKRYKIIYFIVIVTTLITDTILAYPPAPHHTIEGLVRNEYGKPIVGDNISVMAISKEGGKEISEVNNVYRPGVNYSLNIPMESTAGRNFFYSGAFRQEMDFTLKILINGKEYLPIEMIGNTTKMGIPGEVTLLDLTIGEDIDGDGLPDAWERSIATITGKNIEQIKPNDDSDGDGLTNIQEYISGSYAFDKNDGVIVELKSINSNRAILQFMAISGRSYSIESSKDLKNWNSISFSLFNDESKLLIKNIIAKKFGQIKIEVPIRNGDSFKNNFFKLKVK